MVWPGSNDQRVAQLQEAGAEFVQADLGQPATLEAACQGCASVFSSAIGVSGAPRDIAAIDLRGHLELIAAARAAGVRRFVYISFSGNVEPHEPSPLAMAKRQVEERLKPSGLD